jgi:hypothetical protein
MAIVAVLSQFKLFTVKDIVHYWPLLLTLTPLSMLIALRVGFGVDGVEVV